MKVQFDSESITFHNAVEIDLYDVVEKSDAWCVLVGGKNFRMTALIPGLGLRDVRFFKLGQGLWLTNEQRFILPNEFQWFCILKVKEETI